MRFENGDIDAFLSEAQRRRKTRETTADDCDRHPPVAIQRRRGDRRPRRVGIEAWRKGLASAHASLSMAWMGTADVHAAALCLIGGYHTN